jgi:hypothetical protein
VKIPDALQAAIAEAERRLALDQHGTLDLSCRQRIWAALGPRQAFRPGHRRRTRLAVICVQRVPLAWEKLRPEDDMPQHVLQAVDDYLAGRLDRKAARRLGNEAWTHGDNVTYAAAKAKDRSMQRVSLVCSATVRALYQATGDDKAVPIEVDGSLTDDRLDPYGWDTSYYVNLFVGGRPGKPCDDIGQRRQFWGWYIHEAGPMAWQSETDRRPR